MGGTLVSARWSASVRSDMNPQWPADWKSSAPVTVTWPSHTSAIVSQPIVSWVTSTMAQDRTKNPDEM